jgi:hypothetical protein
MNNWVTNLFKLALGAIFALFIFLGPISAMAQEDTIAYKLATLNIKAENPENQLLGKPRKPEAAMVSEFQWILDTLKNRCLNPETAIADTLVETWTTANQLLNPQGKSLSLLDTSRQLLAVTRNTKIFGTKKVNFRMTSRYWLQQKFGDQFKGSN